MDASINDLILKMEQLLYEKKDALESIYDLTIKQKEDIETNKGDNLEGFIDGKQEQIDKIESIDNLFNNVFQILKKEFNAELGLPKSPASIGDGYPRAIKSSMDSATIQSGLNSPLNEVSFNVDTLDAIDWTLYPNIKVVKNQVSDIMELTRKIIDLENENRDSINKIISEIKDELKRAKLGQKSISAYDKPNINIDGIYIDKKK